MTSVATTRSTSIQANQAGHRYRVVAEYDSPLAESIKDGGMGNMVAAIVPDDPRLWPAIDPEDPTFQKDVQSLGISWTPASKVAETAATRRQ